MIKQLPLLLLCTLLLTCKSPDNQKTESAKSPSKAEKYPRDQTLYVGGWDWSAPHSFNPLAGDPNFPIDGNLNLLYEALFGYNQISGKLEPILAESYSENDSGIIVTLDSRAKWNDGSPVTVADIIFTFEIDKNFETARHSNWKFLEEVRAIDSLQVLFKFNKQHSNPLIIKDMISEVNILPKSVFEVKIAEASNSWENLLKFKNDKNIKCSGPYSLHDYSKDQIILKRNDQYWGKVKYSNRLPAPIYIIHSLYEGNNHFSSAMTKGNLDLSSTYMPRIWTKKKDKVRAWDQEEPYHSPASIPTVFMPISIAPFDDVEFRRALAHAVNYERIRSLAVSRYTPIVKPGFILPFGPESQYFSEDDAQKYGYSYNIEEARKLLAKAGYSWDSKGKILDKKGQLLRSLNLECPQGWTDWENTLNILRDDLLSLGIDAQKKFVDYNTWDQDVKLGQFDLIMKTQTPELWPSTPWKRFDQVMNSDSTSFRPIGEMMHHNFGRYSNPKAQELLNSIPTIKGDSALKVAYRELNKIFMQDVPVLTLMYRPSSFYQFSEMHWNGFPTKESADRSTPQCLMIGAGIKDLWKLNPIK